MLVEDADAELAEYAGSEFAILAPVFGQLLDAASNHDVGNACLAQRTGALAAGRVCDVGYGAVGAATTPQGIVQGSPLGMLDEPPFVLSVSQLRVLWFAGQLHGHVVAASAEQHMPVCDDTAHLEAAVHGALRHTLGQQQPSTLH